MPELPDVEVFRQYISSTALHQRIDSIHVNSKSVLLETSPQALGRTLKHNSFHTTDRHGKYLFVSVNNEKWLVVHFGMTGNIKYFQHGQDEPDYTRLLITFENGNHLAYITSRKLGWIALTDSPQSWVKNNKLGPDAVTLSESDFIGQAKQRRGGIKSWLMDQKSIAGIGNIYSDEILFQARVYPKRSVSDLSEDTYKQLHHAIKNVLETAIKSHADPEQMPVSWLLPNRKRGGHCPRCDTLLETVKAGGRTAWYCPCCQEK